MSLRSRYQNLSEQKFTTKRVSTYLSDIVESNVDIEIIELRVEIPKYFERLFLGRAKMDLKEWHTRQTVRIKRDMKMELSDFILRFISIDV